MTTILCLQESAFKYSYIINLGIACASDGFYNSNWVYCYSISAKVIADKLSYH